MSPGSNRIHIEAYTSDGLTQISNLKISGVTDNAASDEIIIKVKNASLYAASSVLIGVIRSDYLINDPAGESQDVSYERGSEVVAEKWVEARLLETDAWTPIAEAPVDSFEIGALAAGESRTLRLRVNVPASPSSSFDIYFCFVFRALAA